MPYLDNPAGRLYDLLMNLSSQEPQESLLNSWAEVLGVQPEDVVLRLGRVADLVRETQDAVDRTNEQAYSESVQRYRANWARPIFPPDHAFNNRLLDVLPEAPALESLGMISVHLHSTAPEGVIPKDTEIEELRTRLRELIGDVEVAEDLPDDLKHTILRRLQDVEDALQHLDVGGPSAVRHATEAVIGSVALATKGGGFAKYPTINKVCAVVAVAWTIFSIPATFDNSLEAWKGDLPQLTTAIEKPFGSPENESASPEPPPTGDGGTEAPGDVQ
jgi:hypothetical protein